MVTPVHARDLSLQVTPLENRNTYPPTVLGASTGGVTATGYRHYATNPPAVNLFKAYAQPDYVFMNADEFFNWQNDTTDALAIEKCPTPYAVILYKPNTDSNYHIIGTTYEYTWPSIWNNYKIGNNAWLRFSVYVRPKNSAHKIKLCVYAGNAHETDPLMVSAGVGTSLTSADGSLAYSDTAYVQSSTFTVTQVGTSGWYHLVLKAQLTEDVRTSIVSGNKNNVLINPLILFTDASGDTTFAGDGTSGHYVTGPCFQISGQNSTDRPNSEEVFDLEINDYWDPVGVSALAVPMRRYWNGADWSSSHYMHDTISPYQGRLEGPLMVTDQIVHTSRDIAFHPDYTGFDRNWTVASATISCVEGYKTNINNPVAFANSGYLTVTQRFGGIESEPDTATMTIIAAESGNGTHLRCAFGDQIILIPYSVE